MRLSIQLPFDVLQLTILSKCMSWLKPFWHVMWYRSISNYRSIYMSHGINENKNGFIPHLYNQQHNAGTKTNWGSGGRSNGAAKLIPRGGFFLVNKINVLHIWKSKYKPQLSSSNIYAMQFQCMNYNFFSCITWEKNPVTKIRPRSAWPNDHKLAFLKLTFLNFEWKFMLWWQQDIFKDNIWFFS